MSVRDITHGRRPRRPRHRCRGRDRGVREQDHRRGDRPRLRAGLGDPGRRPRPPRSRPRAAARERRRQRRRGHHRRGLGRREWRPATTAARTAAGDEGAGVTSPRSRTRARADTGADPRAADRPEAGPRAAGRPGAGRPEAAPRAPAALAQAGTSPSSPTSTTRARGRGGSGRRAAWRVRGALRWGRPPTRKTQIRKPPEGQEGVEPEGGLEPVDEGVGSVAASPASEIVVVRPRPTEPPAIWNM